MKCPVCEKEMQEQLGRGSINFNPTYHSLGPDVWPESIYCVVTTVYTCLCNVELIIPENKTYTLKKE